MEAETVHHIIFGECHIEDRLTTRVMDCSQAGHSSLRDHGPIGLHHAAVGHLDAHRPCTSTGPAGITRTVSVRSRSWLVRPDDQQLFFGRN
jgi:hypothetical protein